jgi:hypothetical protein
MTINEIVKESNSIRESLIKLNWNITGSNYSKFKKIIKLENINITHFNPFSGKNNSAHKNRIPTNQILIENSTYNNGNKIKKRLYEEGLKKRECELCGQDENWMGKKMSLILDHKNGINNDNRLENLQIVCPNCNATLDTFCGKNVKNSKYNNEYTKKCSCGNNITKEYDTCVKCARIKMRKVKRPEYITLILDIKSLGYSATGKKYGVSDNAIRKWIKNEERLCRDSNPDK